VAWEGERRRDAGQVGEKCGVVVCVLLTVSFKLSTGEKWEAGGEERTEAGRKMSKLIREAGYRALYSPPHLVLEN
jgi:hypothetical protein